MKRPEKRRTITISLPPRAFEELDILALEGGFASKSELIRCAIRLLYEQEKNNSIKDRFIEDNLRKKRLRESLHRKFPDMLTLDWDDKPGPIRY